MYWNHTGSIDTWLLFSFAYLSTLQTIPFQKNMMCTDLFFIVIHVLYFLQSSSHHFYFLSICNHHLSFYQLLNLSYLLLHCYSLNNMMEKETSVQPLKDFSQPEHYTFLIPLRSSIDVAISSDQNYNFISQVGHSWHATAFQTMSKSSSQLSLAVLPSLFRAACEAARAQQILNGIYHRNLSLAFFSAQVIPLKYCKDIVQHIVISFSEDI